MKLTRFTCFAVSPSALLLASALFASSTNFVSADEADNLRADAHKLMKRAQDLKADGLADEAKKVAREAEELEQRANQLQKRVQKEALAGEAKNKKNQLHAKLEELIAQGRTEEAAKLKAQIADLGKRSTKEGAQVERGELEKRMQAVKREIEELRQKGRHEEAGSLEKKARQMMANAETEKPVVRFSPDGSRVISKDPTGRIWDATTGREIRKPAGEPSRGSGEAERRLHHLRAAIENLHAAGLHEPAEKLTQDAQKLQQQLQQQDGPGRPGPERSDGAIRDLQNEVKALRQSVQELRKRLDEGVGKER